MLDLGMKPRDVDELTLLEFERFCLYLDEIHRRRSADV